MSTFHVIKWIRRMLHDYECITLGETCYKCMMTDWGGEG